jgi:predicted extracellular nuclease
MDDGSTVQYPVPVPYLASDNTLRAGDTIAGLSGVLSYASGAYEVHPTEVVNFTRVNDRDTTPSSAGGTLKVASFNVLNYFITLDGSGPICGPAGGQDCRGADTPEEFTRQRNKIISAIVTMDADVIGLMKLENHPADSALQDLVNGLNDSAGAGTYSLIPTGPIGTDAIKVAFIYKPGKVTPVGFYAVLDSSVDPTFIDTKNRPSLAQTFQQNANGEKFTVAVNNFKSKGSPCDDVGDPDMGDGQGNCNLTRADAAFALVNWLATDPTGSGDTDFLIIGDLNAYAMEDPITEIKVSGYTNLIEQFIGDAYSFVFLGQAGYLDHALATESLAPYVTGVTIWHINADEPSALDYNDYNQANLYNPDPYRSSDHDPIIVDLAMNAPPNCSETMPSKDLIWPPNHKLVPIGILGVTDPDGDEFTVTINSIFQDEPVNSTGDGKFAPDGFGVGASSASIRAERKGSGNGRVYHIGFTAQDDRGGQCSGFVVVGVPKSKGKKESPIDDGPIYDSTVE